MGLDARREGMFFSVKQRDWHPGKVYLLISALRGLGMGCHATIYSLFLRDIGIKQDQISALNSLFWLTLILSELPTGMLADGKSRAWSIKVGFLLMSFSIGGYGLAQGFWSALAAEALIAVALAFLSGAEQAWLVDALEARGLGHELKKVYAQNAIWSATAALAGGFLSDLLAQYWGYRLGWFVGGVFMSAGFVLAVVCLGKQGEPKKRLTEWQALKASVAALKASPALIWAVAAAMSLGFINPFNHFWSQFFHGRLQGGSLGWIWIVVYGSCALAGVIIKRVSFVRGREAGAILGLLFLTAAGYAAIGRFDGVYLPLLMVVLHEVGRGAYMPLADVFVQRRIESNFRATYGSLHSFLGRMGNAVILAGVWYFSRSLPDGEEKILSIWSVTGGMLLIAVLLLWFLRPSAKPEPLVVTTASSTQ